MKRNTLLALLGIVIVGFLVLQIFPISAISTKLARQERPVLSQIDWGSPEAEQLVRTACYDCHSNEPTYPWYASVAPISWLLNKDINEGRRVLNFSEQAANQINPHELVEVVEEGEMPLPIYLVMHPDANLTEAQQQTLIQAFETVLSGRGGGD